MSNNFLRAFAFIFLFVLLDRLSFIYPYRGLNISPWNPAPALLLVYILRSRNKTAFLSVFIAVIASDLMSRGMHHTQPLIQLASQLLVTLGYIAIAEVIRFRLAVIGSLDTRQALLHWIPLIGVGTAVNAGIYISLLRFTDFLPDSADWQTAWFRFWIGDFVGIFITFPFFWWLNRQQNRSRLKHHLWQPEIVIYLLVSIMSLWMAFAVGGIYGYRVSYVLFLPVILAAAHLGMVGAITFASVMQLGIVGSVLSLEYSASSFVELQLLALAISVVGFFIGVVVDELKQASEELRHSLRLAAAGEMAGALAHELNQPLTALSAYALACQTLSGSSTKDQKLDLAIKGVLAESRRTAEVVHRLRDFFKTGSTRLQSIQLSLLLQEVLSLYQQKTARFGVEFRIGEIPEVSLLLDPMQIGVVIRNLLSNALDAAMLGKRETAWIRLETSIVDRSTLMITIEDSGPGVTNEDQEMIFEPFKSTKSSGLGLGLAMSRSIVEVHGGTLYYEVADHGVFKLVLPITQA